MLKKKFILILILLIVVFPFTSYLLNYYTDWLFFVETGFSSVFITILYAKTWAGLLFGGLLFFFVQVNLYYANRVQFPLPVMNILGGGNFRFNRDEAVRLVKPAGILLSLILTLFAASWGAMQWEDLLFFINKLAVGTVDPVIGKDIGFYLFSLPFLELLKTFANFVLLITVFLTAAAYYVRGGIMLTERGVSVDKKVRRQLAVLAGI